MYMLGKIIALFHIILVFFYSFYGFATAKNFYADFLYFVFLIVIQLSWLIFNHECLFSLIYKKIFYKNYTTGDNTELADFNELMGSIKPINVNRSNNSTNFNELIGNVLNIIFFINLWIVNSRSNISSSFSVIFIFIFLRYFYIYLNNAAGKNTRDAMEFYFGKKFYRIMHKIYEEYQVESIRESLNMIISITLILYLLCIIYANRKRL